jgi:proteic killer suppression protein
MIQSFQNTDTRKLFDGENIKKFEAFRRVAQRRLEMLQAAMNVTDLKVPQGNKLEKLQGDRKGQYSIRINDQWRLCFTWRDGNAYDVEIADYH